MLGRGRYRTKNQSVAETAVTDHSNNNRRLFLRRVAAAVAVALTGEAPWALAGQANAIRGVRLERDGGTVRVVFDLAGSARHKLFHLNNPSRVVLDFPDTSMGVERLALGPSQLVKRLRYGKRNGDDLRVVLDMARQVPTSTRVRRGADGRQQLIVEFKQPLAAAVEPPKRKPVKTAKKPKPRKPRDLVIAIDAGHGGKDPGAVGKRGTREKQVVLQVARRLAKLLEREPGYRPVLIRNSDTFLPLRERINKARAAKADLFISIHADASPNPDAQGSSVYILSENGASSEAARFLAQQENAVDLIGGVSLDNRDQMLASVLLDLSQRHTIETSEKAARQLLAELDRVGKVHSRKVEKAAFVVLKSPDVPSVLVETAFISNPREEKRLRTRAHQEKLAKSLVRGIRKYFAEHAPDDTLVARMRTHEHVVRRGDTLSGIAQRYRVPVDYLRSVNGLSGDKLLVGKKLKIPVTET